MNDYRKSDYAVNKFSKGIVYRFNNKIVEVTLDAYLRENPDKTEADFIALKDFSDADYKAQLYKQNNQTRKNVSIHNYELSSELVPDLPGINVEKDYIDKQDRQVALQSLHKLLTGNKLTETQARRFKSHVLEGKTFREIAKREGVNVNAIEKSVYAAIKALRREFEAC